MRGRFLVGLACATGALIVAACSTTTWQTGRLVRPGYTETPRKTFVIYVLSREAQALNADSLSQHISNGLGECGIESNFSFSIGDYGKSDKFDLEQKKDVAKLIDNFKPDSLLMISERSKSQIKGWGTNYQDIGRYYGAIFYDYNVKAAVWQSDIYVTASNGLTQHSPEEKGRALAQDILGYMAGDGILRTCPSSTTAKAHGSPKR